MADMLGGDTAGLGGVGVSVGADVSDLYRAFEQATHAAAEAGGRIASALEQGSGQVGKLKPPIDELKPPLDNATGGANKLASAIGMIAQAGVAMKAVGIVSDLVQQGVHAQTLKATFDNLAQSVGGNTTQALQALRRETGGLVDDLSLLETGNMFLAMNLATTTDQAAELAGISTKLAMAMGHDAKEGASSFAMTLANQSLPRLDTFGISSGRVRTRIQELQQEFVGLSREEAFTMATLEEARKTLERVGDVSETATGKIAALTTATANAKASFAESVASATWWQSITGVVTQATTAVGNYFGKVAEGRPIMNAFEADLKAMYEAGDLSRESYRAMSGEVDKLFYSFEYTGMPVDELRRRLWEINPAAADATGMLEGLRGTVSALSGSWEEYAASSMQAIVDQRMTVEEQVAAAQASAIAGEEFGTDITAGMQTMYDAFKGEEFQSALVDSKMFVEQWATDIATILGSSGEEQAAALATSQTALGDVQRQYEAGEVAAREAFQLKLHNLQGQHQQKYAMLVAQGKMQEAAQLQSEFDRKVQQENGQYAYEEQLRKRAMYQQQLVQLEAYRAELVAKQDAVLKSLALTVMKAETEGTITAEAATANLQVILAAGTEQLRLEIETKRASMKAAEDWASGHMSAALAVAESIQALETAQTSAGDAISQIKSKIDSFKIALPPMPALDTSAVAASGPKVSSSLAKATEPATKKMSDIAKDLNLAIKESREALMGLLGFEAPPELEAKFQEFASYIRIGAQALHDALADMDAQAIDKAEDVGEVVADLTNAFVQLGDLAQLDELNVPGDRGVIGPLIEWWIDMSVYAMNGLEVIQDRIGYNRIKKYAHTAERMGKVFTALQIDFDKIAKNERPDIRGYVDAMWQVAENAMALVIHMDWLYGDKRLAELAVMAGSLGEIMQLAQQDLTNVGKTAEEAPDLAKWKEQFIGAIVTVKTALEEADRDLTVMKVDQVSERVKAYSPLIDLAGKDLTKIATNVKWPSMETWKAQFVQAILAVVGGIEEVVGILETPGAEESRIEAASEKTSQFTALFSLMGQDFASMKVRGAEEDIDLTVWKTQFVAAATTVAEAVEGVQANLGDDRLETAAENAQHVSTLANLFSADVTAMKTWEEDEAPSLDAWKTSFIAAIGTVVDVVEEVGGTIGEEKVAEAAANADDLSKIARLFSTNLKDFKYFGEEDKPPDLAAWRTQFIQAIRQVKEVSEGLRDYISSEDEKALADESDQLVKIARLLSTDLSKLGDIEPGGDYSVWASAFKSAIKTLATAIQEIKADLGGDVLEGAAASSEYISKVARILGVDLSKVQSPGPLFAANLVGFTTGFDLALDTLVTWIDEFTFRKGPELVEKVSEQAEQIEKVAALLGFAESFKAIGEAGGELATNTEIDTYADSLEYATDTMIDSIDYLDQKWGDLIPRSAEVSKNIAEVYQNIGRVAKSIDDAAELGGIDVGAGWAMMQQLTTLAGGMPSVQAIPTYADIASEIPKGFGAGGGGAGGLAAAGPGLEMVGLPVAEERKPATVRLELTINVPGWEDAVRFSEMLEDGELIAKVLDVYSASLGD